MQVVKLKHSDTQKVRAAVLMKQGGKCPICERVIAPDAACLDHDHETGRIRGVLCRVCNRAEGKIKGITVVVKNIISGDRYLDNLLRYRRYHQENPSNAIYPAHKTQEEKAEIRKARAKAARLKNKQG